MTLTLGAEEVELPADDVAKIRDRLLERDSSTQDLRDLLTEALRTGNGRIDEEHRPNLGSVIKAIKMQRPGDYTLELDKLWQVAQKPIIPKPD